MSFGNIERKNQEKVLGHDIGSAGNGEYKSSS